MRGVEIVELTLIAMLTLAAGWFAAFLPARLSIGALALVAASMFLAQGLLRDLWLLSRRRTRENPSSGVVSRCLCVESGIGVFSVVLGIALILSRLGGNLSVGRTGWIIVVGTVLTAGFLLKDWVFEWSPWRLRREKDHANVIFAWRKK